MRSTSLDAAGHPRAAVKRPGYHTGRSSCNKGRRFPADPPTVEEIVAVMRAADLGRDGARLRALIVLLWRAGLRISEALALAQTDLDGRRGAILIRHGKGDKRREVGMDTWAREQLEPWQRARAQFPVGTFFCVIHGPIAGRPCEASSVRRQLQRTAATAGVRRRFAPHQLRHAHAVEMARDGVPLLVIERQLGHANLGITSIYLQGIDNSEVIDAVHALRSPVIPATAGLHTTALSKSRSLATSEHAPRSRPAGAQRSSASIISSTRPSPPTHLHG